MITIKDRNGLLFTIAGTEVTAGTNNKTENRNALPKETKKTKIILHEYVFEYKLTRIGDSAFRYSEITCVFIPATVKSIGFDAFGYVNDFNSWQQRNNLIKEQLVFIFTQNII